MTGPERRAGRLASRESPLIPMQGGELRQPKRAMGFLDLVLFYVLTVITLLNVIGLDSGKWLYNAGALAMWLPVMMVIVLGVVAWRRFGSATSFTTMTMTPSTHFKDIIFWSSLTFAFGGCETASFMGEEIKKARRAIPLALLTAGMVVTFCYVMGTVGVLLALPHNQVSDLEGLMQAITETAARLGFFWIIPMAAALIAISNLGAAGAYLAALSRLPFVAGIQSLLPPFFCELATRLVTPPFCRLLR